MRRLRCLFDGIVVRLSGLGFAFGAMVPRQNSFDGKSCVIR